MITIEENKRKSLGSYKFIDLFAGIGGFHLALESLGSNCVFASEWDKFASKTYYDNFGLQPNGDITKIQEKEIPNHDILCGGFPCQAFSISGKQKGFDDIRGTLFFDIARIVEHHKPKVLFLENVKNLSKHDDGKTLKTILTTLEKLEYNVFTKIFNASNFGLPQNRERIYIVAFKKSINFFYSVIHAILNQKLPTSITIKRKNKNLPVFDLEDEIVLSNPYGVELASIKIRNLENARFEWKKIY